MAMQNDKEGQIPVGNGRRKQNSPYNKRADMMRAANLEGGEWLELVALLTPADVAQFRAADGCAVLALCADLQAMIAAHRLLGLLEGRP